MKYTISIIPNYGNDDIIVKKVMDDPDIRSNGKTYDSGFIGCDVPVNLDIECTSEAKDRLERELREINTDTFGIYQDGSRC